MDDGEIFEATVFLHHFKDLTDTRQQAKVVYPLDEVLLLALLATLAGAESFTDIARFGEKKLTLLRRFRPFKDGTPPHDRVGDIFATLDAEQFQRCFVAWVASMTGLPDGVIAIDGKTVRRSGPVGSQKRRQGANPHGLGFCRAPTPRAGTGESGWQCYRILAQECWPILAHPPSLNLRSA